MFVKIAAALLLVMPFTLVSQERVESNPENKDKAAIKSVIEKQIDAYRSRDLQGEMALWLESEDVMKVTDQGKCIRGWKNLRNRYATLFADPDFIKLGECTTTTDNFNFVFYGDLAWVVHNQQDVYKRGLRQKTLLTIQTRILKKIDGQWKILFQQTANVEN